MGAHPEGQDNGPQGGVAFSDSAIAKLAAYAARTTYGVVDLHSAPMRRVADLFRGVLTEGVEVQHDGDAVHVRLHVVMERGVNVAQVTAILRDQVAYQIERATGLGVSEVDVLVEDLRE